MQRLAALISLFTFVAVSDAVSYKPDPGPYEVRMVDDVQIADKTRAAPLSVRIYAPMEPTPSDDTNAAQPAEREPHEGELEEERSDKQSRFPLVVFSHGLGGSNNAFEIECAYWASHGYVVVVCEHLDSMRHPELRASLRRLSRSKRWERRVLDQKLVIDRVEEWAQAVEGLGADQVDLDRIATAGHSYGAQTAVLMAGGRVERYEGSALLGFAEERVDIAIPISPQGPGQAGFADASWSELRIPALFITGTHDESHDGFTPENRTVPFRNAPAGDKHLLVIDGATHSSFLERTRHVRPDTRSNDPAHAHHTRQVTLAFLDAHLKEDEGAHTYLNSEGKEGPADIGTSTARFEKR